MTYTLDLTENEMQSLIDLIDAACRSTGIKGARAAAPLVDKIEITKRRALKRREIEEAAETGHDNAQDALVEDAEVLHG